MRHDPALAPRELAEATPDGPLARRPVGVEDQPAAAGEPVDPSAAEPSASLVDWILAGYLLVTASTALVMFDPRLRHWFIVPVTASGVLLGGDVVGWFRRRFDIFDPQALLGLLGLQFFYLAPILHVVWDYWPARITPPSDWREALGAMATLNLAGLVLYRWMLAIRSSERPASRRVVPVALYFDEQRFYRMGLLAVLLGLAAFGAEIFMFGGFDGFLFVVTQDRSALAGTGWLIILAESFPFTIFALVVVRWRRTLTGRPGRVVLLLIGLALVQFLVGGLRGSRSSTVWPVLLGLMLVHLLVLRISRKALLACGVVFLVFMYCYGFYKDLGVGVVDVARGTSSASAISSNSERDLRTVILADLGRADIQALVLDREREGGVRQGYGMTYLGAVAALVPRALLPERPPGKLVLGTEVLYGPGFYDPDTGRWSNRVYGLTGEAMLNFGPPAAVLAFLPFGLVVRRSRRFYRRACQQPALAPKLLAPALCVATVLLLTSDLDNMTFFLAQRFMPLAMVVVLAISVRSTPRPGPARAGRHAPAPPGGVPPGNRRSGPVGSLR